MTTLALLLLAPLLWPLVAKWRYKHELTIPEVLLCLAIGLGITSAGWALGRFSQVADHEVLNGQVTSKTSERVSCEHSYQCNCVESCSTDSNGNRSCSTTCSTCYDHSYDVDWLLKTSLSDIKIDRVDRRGLDEPPRFSVAKPGDPVAETSRYVNYIKGAPDSLFNALSEKQAKERFAAKLPDYPLNVHDYHYLNRVIPVGVQVPDLAEWNRALALRLRELGPAKQLNLVFVLTNETDPAYALALRAHWLGGKKNDVVVVLGTPKYPNIDWVNVISWTDQELFKVELRDALLSLKTAAPVPVLDVVEQHARKGYVRKPMADFDYLAYEIEPPDWALALLALLGLGASLVATRYFANNEVRAFSGSWRPNWLLRRRA